MPHPPAFQCCTATLLPTPTRRRQICPLASSTAATQGATRRVDRVDRAPRDAPPAGRRRKGPITPAVIQERRRRREENTSTRDVLVARWGGVVLAKSSRCEFVDGRFYFPKASVAWEYLVETDYQKMHNPVGRAVYYDVVVPGVRCRNRKSAWSFRNLKRQWKQMEGLTAFWKGVSVTVAEVGGVDSTKNFDDL